MALYDGKPGIKWNGLQLVDVLLPALSAVETDMGTGSTSGIQWIKRDTTAARWYRALIDAMGEVIIDVAKLLTHQSCVQKCSYSDVELARPELRRILRAHPTFSYTDTAYHKTTYQLKNKLNDLVPLRVGPKTLWVYESSIDKFMTVGKAERVIRPGDLQPDDLAIRPREEKEMQEQAMADDRVAVDENRLLEERSAAEYENNIAVIEDVYGLSYDRNKPYDILATPALDEAFTYDIGATYS